MKLVMLSLMSSSFLVHAAEESMEKMCFSDYAISMFERKASALDATEITGFQAICAKLSDEEFNAELACMDRSWQFKGALFKAIQQESPLLHKDLRRDVRIAKLQDIADEMRERFGRWMAYVGIDASEKPFDADLYGHIVIKFFDPPFIVTAHEDAEVLYDIFRSIFLKHEIDCCGIPDYRAAHWVAIRWHELGQKLNAPLCPKDPKDTRTLYYAYILSNKYDLIEGHLFPKFYAELSSQERALEAERLQYSDEFGVWYDVHEKKLKESKSLEHVQHIIKAGENQRLQQISLFSMLMPMFKTKGICDEEIAIFFVD